MEAGKVQWDNEDRKIDLIDAMVAAVDDSVSDNELAVIERSACPTCGSCSGMFTANSMNCLTEALGLALPGNGSVLATHADRKELFLEAGRRIVELARRYYEHDDTSILPRSIASFEGFENAITMDIAMGGSTNTVLHLLAAAHEAQVGFTMADIDRLSRQVPCVCKVAPNIPNVHLEDVHRAGGIMAILGELDRAGLIHTDLPTVHSPTMKDALDKWDVARNPSEEVKTFYRAAPGGIPTQTAFSQNRRFEDLDVDRENGCIRNIANAFSTDGGLAVLFGNLAEHGCIVKTAGVDENILKFIGPAKVFESQDSAVSAILSGGVEEGDVVVIRYEGAQGRTRHAGNALSHQLSQSQRPGQSLRARDGRALFRRHIGAKHWPCLAGSGRRWHDRPGERRRHHRNRHSQPRDQSESTRDRAGTTPRQDDR